jgi:hypothetical protein
MESLLARAGDIEPRPVRLPSGGTAVLRAARVQLADATPGFLKPGALASTYTSKPLVSVKGDAMFGELAVVRLLEADGWEAVWVDTFHRAFWRGMPHRTPAVALPPAARARYDAIVAANDGRAAGFFDVMAWRGDRFAFLEYKGAGDSMNRNAARWVEAALDVGVPVGELWIVERK